MPRYGFGGYSVDTDTVEVFAPDGLRACEPQVFDVLRYLIEQRGRLVTKEELLDNVWGDRFVSESALTTRIKQARRLVDDDGRTQWAIKTVHGRGYRFLPDVAVDADRPLAPSTVSPAVRAVVPLPEALRADTRRLFCGRETELAQAVALFDQSHHGDTPVDGSFRWIWLLGEPGIGKSRLAAEIARLAHGQGQRVLLGRNNEDLRVPYQPFIEAIRSTVEAHDPEDRATAVAALSSELEPLLPEIGSGTMSVATEGPVGDSGVGDESRRFRLFEAVAGWLISVGTAGPVMLIIDDVHWAADSTLQLLAHLQRRQGGSAVTVVATARDTAPDTNPRVADLIAAGHGAPNSAVLRLAGLSDDDARKLVGDRVELGDVMRQTAGNPLLLQAVDPADGSVDVPSAVRRRLANLGERVRGVLALASVLGLEFELRVVAAAADRDELDVLDDLEQSVGARIVDDVGVDRFRFTHALIRSSFRDELSSARLTRMHGRIASAIDSTFPDDPSRVGALAFHTAEAVAGDASLAPLAVERLQRAADEAVVQLSFGDAARLLQRARGFADPADLLSMARLALQQGTAEMRAGMSEAAVRTLEVAIESARSGGDPMLQIESVLRYEDAAWRPGGHGLVALGHVNEAIEVLDAAIADGVELVSADVLRARLATAQLRALALAGRIGDAERAFPAALALNRSAGAASLEAAVINVCLTQIRFFVSLDDTAALVVRLAELEPDIDDGDVALHAIHVRLLYAMLAGSFDDHRALVDEMTTLQQESHSVFWEFIRANQAAMEVFYAGDLAASERMAEYCLSIADDLPEEDGSGAYGLRMFMIRREQDRLSTIAPALRHVLARGDVDGVWTPGLALLLIETGAPDEAASSLEAIKAQGFRLPVDAMWSTVMVFLIEAFVALADVEACAVLRDRFARTAGSNITTGSGLLCFGRAERYLGMLSLVMGELDAAEDHLGTALEADSRGGSALWSNESRLWLARVRRLQGHSAEAQVMFEVVEREAADAGLRRLERLAAHELDGGQLDVT